MISSMHLKSIAFDILAGFSCFLVLDFCRIFLNTGYEIREASVIAAISFLIAGLIRGLRAREALWWRGFVIASIGLVAAYRILELSLLFISILSLVAFSLTACGILAGRSWRLHSRARSAVFLLAPVMLVLLAVTAGPAVTEKIQERYPYSLAPAFSFSAPDGKIINSMELKGHVVVLSFWATWCLPCIRELPALVNVREQYKEVQGVVIWAVNIENQDTPEKVRAFLEQKGYRIPVGFDSDHSAARRFNVRAIPAVFVLDKAGRIRMTRVGFGSSSELISALTGKINALLHET